MIRVKRLQRVLSSTSIVRPAMVARAKKLVHDRDYPSRAVLQGVACMFSRVICQRAVHRLSKRGLDWETGRRNRLIEPID